MDRFAVYTAEVDLQFLNCQFFNSSVSAAVHFPFSFYLEGPEYFVSSGEDGRYISRIISKTRAEHMFMETGQRDNLITTPKVPYK